MSSSVCECSLLDGGPQHLQNYSSIILSYNDELNGSLVPRPPYHNPSKLEAGHYHLWYAKTEQPLFETVFASKTGGGKAWERGYSNVLLHESR